MMSVTGQLRDIVSMGRGGDNHISLPWAMWQLLGGGRLPYRYPPTACMHSQVCGWHSSSRALMNVDPLPLPVQSVHHSASQIEAPASNSALANKQGVDLIARLRA